MMSLSAAGLGALLHAFPAVFDVLRWTGAAYLAYLGVQTWRSPIHAEDKEAPSAMERQATPGTLYRRGLLVSASNPKAILFAAAFLPQFIRPERPQLPQFAILLLTFAVIEIGWYIVYAGSGRRLAALLRRASVARVFNRVTGGIFVAFAAFMAESGG